jgi:FAD/FMN-containing dehydrogenase/ferredoxin
VSWSSYWMERARNASSRQRRLYDLEVPAALNKLLKEEEPHLGLTDTLRVITFVVFGSPRARFHLFWHHLADRDTPARFRRIDALAKDLRGLLSDQCRLATGAFERQNYSRDLARVPRILEKMLYRTKPLLVVQPKHEEDILATLAFARKRRIPVYPRGVSSSAFGGTVPTRNGMVLDLSCMKEILAIDRASLTVRLQPGARWADLASRLERHGLACVSTPSSRFSTVGGWASTGGLGIDGFGYGQFSQAIAAARVVLMDGRVLELKHGDKELPDFLGTEGQLGIFTELTLRVRLKANYSSPRLVYSAGARAAFDFVDRLIAGGHRPTHVVFYDRERMVEENRLFRDRTGRDRAIVEERDAVLLHFDDADLERMFLDSAESKAASSLASGPAARYLWTERFFPLKAQRLGPGLLASEVVLPRESVPCFVDRARRPAAYFGIKPAIEAIVSRLAEGKVACVVIATFPCDPTRRWNYLLCLALVQMLVHEGLRLGGHPYGLGIWNAPFLASSYSVEQRRRLLRRKQEADPQQLLNPHKFFGVRTRLFNLPGLIFRPTVFRAALGLARVLSPLLGAAARIGEPAHDPRWNVPSPEEEDGVRLLVQAALRCTSCGSCVSTCPAYLLTRDELVTGRSKLRMAEAWLAGEEIRAAEAHSPFQCLRCGLCEEVCQTRLPLRDCYLILEKWIEKQHGYPRDLVQGFVQRLDADRQLILVTFGLDLPDWLPDGPPPDLCVVQRSMEASA